MPSLPREVHEVLEHEYVSMYGPLDRVAVEYTEDQVTDEAWAVRILCGCELDDKNASKSAIAARLNTFLLQPPPGLIESPALTGLGRMLLEQYSDFAAEARRQGCLADLNRRIVDDAFTGAVRPQRDRRLAAVYAALHERAKDPARARTALCISGGGIRSATFALGVIQGLASAGILDKFDYLSTVSGGGYVGGWLSSWARRHPLGISGVQKDLADSDTAVGGTRPVRTPDAPPVVPEARIRKVEPEPQPVRHLREFSNYLSPRMGLLSGDSWTLISIYSRNVFLNLLVLVPILAALLSIPRAYAWLARNTSAVTPVRLLPHVYPWVARHSYAAPEALAYSLIIVACLFAAFGHIGRTRPVEYDPKPGKKTTDGRFIVRCILPLMAVAVALTELWAAVNGDERMLGRELWITGAAAVFAMTLWPWALYRSRVHAAYAKAPATTFADVAKLRKHLRIKSALELGGTLLGFATASALLVLLAVKVFDKPVQDFEKVLDQAVSLVPAMRPAWIPWSSLYIVFAVPTVMLVLSLQATIFIGISSKRNEDYDREWWGRAGGWLLVAAAAWALLSAITVFGPVALYGAPVLLASVGGLSGLFAGLLGFSGKTAANDKQKGEGGKGGTKVKAGNAALGLAVPLFVLFLLSVIALGTTWLVQEIKPIFDPKKKIDYTANFVDTRMESKTKRVVTLPGGEVVTDESQPAPRVSLAQLRSLNHLDSVYSTTIWELLALLAAALLAYGFSYFIGVNRFSMNALYRNRLIRAYLGASRYSRQPNPFTGFDPRDNLSMYQLRPELLWSIDLKDPESFFRALKEGVRTTETGLSGIPLHRRRLAQHLWSRFYEKTRRLLLDVNVTSATVDAVVQNVNELLLDEQQLLETTVELPRDFWTLTPAGKTTYPPGVRNRAVFDYYFCDILTPMARPTDARGSAARVEGPARAPIHVINMAVNLVAGEKLAWQQRMALSFTATPYDTGSVFLGYRDSRVYGGRDGISLGSAVAVSGAAASPNMGYHSSPALAFLLTLFNVRLGAWLGNPGPAGQASFTQAHPDSNLDTMLREAVGQTNDSYPWVYLSDGGHFENLGLYEMILRRCHTIILSDAGADPKYSFDDLGNAIRKIRTDLGVPIDIEKTFMFPRTADSMSKEGRYVATATIRYKTIDGPDATDGLLIYLKPGCYNEDTFPRDVYNYALESIDFPHESTSDQFFSESQFESYRALGRHVINEICGNYPGPKSTYPKIPIANQYDDVTHFATWIQSKANSAAPMTGADLIASAIRQLKT